VFGLGKGWALAKENQMIVQNESVPNLERKPLNFLIQGSPPWAPRHRSLLSVDVILLGLSAIQYSVMARQSDSPRSEHLQSSTISNDPKNRINARQCPALLLQSSLFGRL
jgi:hypothetical protein